MPFFTVLVNKMRRIKHIHVPTAARHRLVLLPPPASPPPPRDLGSPVLGSDPGVLGGFLALGGGTADPLRALARNSGSCARCILHRRPSAGVSPCPALWGGTRGPPPPRDGCLELNPLRLHYRPQSPEPWLLSRGAQHGEGGERDERDVALSAPLPPPPAQGAPQEDEEKPPPSLTPPKSIQPRHRGGGGGFAPPGHSWMASR